jgi:hypothetical protein
MVESGNKGERSASPEPFTLWPIAIHYFLNITNLNNEEGYRSREKSPPLLCFSMLFTGGKQRKAFWALIMQEPAYSRLWQRRGG